MLLDDLFRTGCAFERRKFAKWRLPNNAGTP
jgi:hypothetical protein